MRIIKFKTEISPTQRMLNIIARAEEIGFEADPSNSLCDLCGEASVFLEETAPASYEDEVEVETTGQHQHVSWCDGYGYEYDMSGEIVDFRDQWNREEGVKIYHSTVVNSLAQVVRLYYVQPKTDMN